MTAGNIAITFIEILVAALIIVGLFNEEKLAELEEKLFASIKAFFRKCNKKISAKRRDRSLLTTGKKFAA